MIKRYVIDYNLKNGIGHPAISLYLTGCDKPVKCHGCHNWEIQEQSKLNYDIETIKSELDVFVDKFLCFHRVLYFSILGGEPLAEYNVSITTDIARYMKEKHSAKIVLYSWRGFGQLGEVAKYLDYAILGAYEETKHQEGMLPASSNQIIWDFSNKNKLSHIKLK